MDQYEQKDTVTISGHPTMTIPYDLGEPQSQNISCVLIRDYSLWNGNIKLCTVKITNISSIYTISSLYRTHSKHKLVNELIAHMDNVLSQSICSNNNIIIS